MKLNTNNPSNGAIPYDLINYRFMKRFHTPHWVDTVVNIHINSQLYEINIYTHILDK